MLLQGQCSDDNAGLAYQVFFKQHSTFSRSGWLNVAIIRVAKWTSYATGQISNAGTGEILYTIDQQEHDH
jgi:hypothetical protein